MKKMYALLFDVELEFELRPACRQARLRLTGITDANHAASQFGCPNVEKTLFWTSCIQIFLSMPKRSNIPYTDDKK